VIRLAARVAADGGRLLLTPVVSTLGLPSIEEAATASAAGAAARVLVAAGIRTAPGLVAAAACGYDGAGQ
jgi:hypothetical protein